MEASQFNELTKQQKQVIEIIEKNPGLEGNTFPKHLARHLRTLELLKLIEYKGGWNIRK